MADRADPGSSVGYTLDWMGKVSWTMWGTCFSLAVLGWLLHASRGQTLRTVQTCTNSTSESLKLTCETGEIIHVVSVQYQNMTADCESPPGGSCVFRQETQADSLYTECNGVATCEMEVQKFWMDAVCGDTTNYKAVISYECISDAPIDVCNNVTQLSKQNVNRLYLASPNYPRLNIASSGTCSCDVTGHNLSVTVLEYYFTLLGDVRANLTLTGDTSTWTSFTAGMIAYNSLVMNSTDSLKIVFDAIPASAKKKEILWLKVEGSSAIQVACNGSPPPPSITPATTDRTTHDTGSLSSLTTSNTTVAVASTSPGRTQRQPDGDSSTVAVAVGCVFAVIVIAALIVIVIFIMLRRKRLKPYLSSTQKPSNGRKEDEAHEMPRYVTDVPYCTTADQIRRPPSAEYAELHAHGAIKVYNVKVSVANSDGRDQSSSLSATPGSAVPYTSKRLEELYAKVIPKKFRSTKNRDEVKDKSTKDETIRDKSVRDESVRDKSVRDKSVRDESVRDESVRDKSVRDKSVRDKSVRDKSVRDSVHAYDNATEEQVTKQRPVSKGGRHVSEPDYQEIGEVSEHTTNLQAVQDPPVFLPHPPPSSPSSDQGLPVPETSEGADRDVEEMKSDQKKRTKNKRRERSKSSDNGVSSKEKKRKKRKGKISKSEKEKSNIQYEEIEIPSVYKEGSVDPANASTSPSTDSGNTDNVMVDNDLYEGGPADGQHTESSGGQRPQSQHYEDIRRGAHSALTHVNIDMNPGRPPPYEEVTI
ncbi:uncharacterized protein LOC124260417 isoform X2 [Haliotis rubra]|uniref:uncharacterized protein LOC124260417 isoform X2 n=1 Tax=Haliotis rubra TaxID=36100 RepID=UPI001EE5F5BF|nr:uncharacterized protein LOC124260417 isoform X2 [Haliotis rubra]